MSAEESRMLAWLRGVVSVAVPAGSGVARQDPSTTAGYAAVSAYLWGCSLKEISLSPLFSTYLEGVKEEEIRNFRESFR